MNRIEDGGRCAYLRRPMTREQENFLRKVSGPALDAERNTGIPACVTVAQSILESAGKINGAWQWGGSSLFRLANNAFGMKDSHFLDQFESAGGNYGEFDVKTSEIGPDGQAHEQIAAFAKFFSLKESFFAHSMLLARLKRYQEAFEVRGDWRQFAVAIMEAGYSTDRPELCKIPGCLHYAGKLIRLIDEYKLSNPATLHYFAGAGAAKEDSGSGIQDSAPTPDSRVPIPGGD